MSTYYMLLLHTGYHYKYVYFLANVLWADFWCLVVVSEWDGTTNKCAPGLGQAAYKEIPSHQLLVVQTVFPQTQMEILAGSQCSSTTMSTILRTAVQLNHALEMLAPSAQIMQPPAGWVFW